ncbi:serendipity locus protein alpha-like [Macrosteles quadrilineatus]|uniref:serendipity locus protein alpha-like n=1 Tax=Macrosteles quadrilineatus TaxID=74068 RepID=UPI0023E16440|nr:serendipity locus protein alpha-like [Macrosteles quadrilineatus]
MLKLTKPFQIGSRAQHRTYVWSHVASHRDRFWVLCCSYVTYPDFLKRYRLFPIQGVWYACERLRCCVSELRQICCTSGKAEDNNGDSGSFLLRVDEALQLLEVQGSSVASESSWTQLINDIIYQAVTIAKMATDLDYNEITSACHGILEMNSQLVNEGSANSNQLSHLTDAMFNHLVTLEERVNLAILRLFLQVFSEPCRPVKQLVRQCRQAPPDRSLGDLDPQVAELDTHIERVMLIVQFAVSCCENATRVLGMRCCLASVESIDNYLVPALKALYLTAGCEDKRRFAHLLCDHWQDETKNLQSHLDNIIDSTAFIRVVQESVNDLSQQLCRGETKEEVGRAIVKQSWLLYKHLSGSGLSLDLTQLKQCVSEFEAAVNCEVSLAAVVKRARLVLSAIDKIADSQNNTQPCYQQPLDENTNPEPSQMVRSIRDLPLDISLSTSKSQHASYRPPWLQRKINDLKEKTRVKSDNIKLKEEKDAFSARSVVENCITPDHKAKISNFQTPKNTVDSDENLLTPFLKKTTERNATLYQRTPRRVVQNQMLDSLSPASQCSWSVGHPASLVLDISEILDSLSELADTFSSIKEAEAISWQQPQPTPASDAMHKYFSGNSLDSQWFSLASVRTDEVSADVETPERLLDLQRVDEKIRNLKLS